MSPELREKLMAVDIEIGKIFERENLSFAERLTIIYAAVNNVALQIAGGDYTKAGSLIYTVVCPQIETAADMMIATGGQATPDSEQPSGLH